MSPPASAIACAIFATMPRWFLPVVVTTARPPRRESRGRRRPGAPLRLRRHLARHLGDEAAQVGVLHRGISTRSTTATTAASIGTIGLLPGGSFSLSATRAACPNATMTSSPGPASSVSAHTTRSSVGSEAVAPATGAARRAADRRGDTGARAAASGPAPAAISRSTRQCPRRVRGTCQPAPSTMAAIAASHSRSRFSRPGAQHVARARAERHRHVFARARVQRVARDHQPPGRAPLGVARGDQQQRLPVQPARLARGPHLTDDRAPDHFGPRAPPAASSGALDPGPRARRPASRPGCSSMRSTTPSTAASTGMSLPPADARAGAPRQTMTSSPTPASTSSVATRCRVAERRLVDRVRPDDQQLRPLQARVAPRRPDLTDDAPEDHRAPSSWPSTMPMTMSLSATSAPTVRSRTRLPCATSDAIAGAGGQAVDRDHQPVGLAARRGLGPDQQQLAPGEARRLPRRPEPPNDPAQDHGSPVVRYRFLALARADFTAAADFFAFALFSGFAAFLAATGRRRLGGARGLRRGPDRAAVGLRRGAAGAAGAAPLRRLQHVEQPAVRELLQLGDVVLVLGALQLFRGRRDQLVVAARLLGAAWRPRTAGPAWCWTRRAAACAARPCSRRRSRGRRRSCRPACPCRRTLPLPARAGSSSTLLLLPPWDHVSPSSLDCEGGVFTANSCGLPSN